MRFADIDTIWRVDLSALSKADRGRVFFERAKQVVGDVLADPTKQPEAINGKRFLRSYLVEKIGCQPAVTSQNPKIRQLLVDTDQRLAQEEGLAVAVESGLSKRRKAEQFAMNSCAANSVLAKGLIIDTNTSCQIHGRSWAGIPTLVWPEGIDKAASDWLRELVVSHGVATSSAREYAKILRPFLRFCRQRSRAWQSVDDEFLVMWREHLRRGQEVSVGRVNASLKTVFAFYRWAEESKRIRYQVGVYAQGELPDAYESVAFPISAKRNYAKGPHGGVYGAWTTPLTLSEPSKGARVRHTPTEDEIRDLHEVAVEHEQGERDSLLFSWAEEAGPRRAELLRLCKSHMPTDDQLAALIERDEPWLITVKRKGGASKPLHAPVDLIIRTLDFVQFSRREVVEHCQKNIVGYQEPDEIFLSSTTGLVLHPDSVTSIGRRTFRKAGIAQANIHRLRARFAVRTIETLVDAVFGSESIGPNSNWIETILIKAAEAMGHSNPQSLRPYLTYVLNRRIQAADATKVTKLESRLRQLKLQEGTIVRRIDQHHKLQIIARQMQAGNDVDAAAALREIADQLG